MSEKSKPLSEWTLGEAKAMCEKRDSLCLIPDECQFHLRAPNESGHVCAIFAPPRKFDLTDFLRLTPDELTLCSLMGATWVSREDDDGPVLLWREEPSLKARACEMWPDCFPSIRAGDCICVEETMSDGD